MIIFNEKDEGKTRSTRPPELKSRCFIEFPSGGKEQVKMIHTGRQTCSAKLPRAEKYPGLHFRSGAAGMCPWNTGGKTNLLDHDDFSRFGREDLACRKHQWPFHSLFGHWSLEFIFPLRPQSKKISLVQVLCSWIGSMVQQRPLNINLKLTRSG